MTDWSVIIYEFAFTKVIVCFNDNCAVKAGIINLDWKVIIFLNFCKFSLMLNNVRLSEVGIRTHERVNNFNHQYAYTLLNVLLISESRYMWKTPLHFKIVWNFEALLRWHSQLNRSPCMPMVWWANSSRDRAKSLKQVVTALLPNQTLGNRCECHIPWKWPYKRMSRVPVGVAR